MKNQILNTFDIIKTYRWRSIFFVYFKKILVFILVPLIIITLFINFYIQKTIEYNYQNNFNEAFYKTNNQINAMFTEIDNYYNLLNTNELLLFTKSSLTGLADANAKNTQKLLNSMQTMKRTSKFISNISVYRFTDDYVLSTFGSGYLNSYYNTEWFDAYSQTGKTNTMYYFTSNNTLIPDALTITKGIYSGKSLIGFMVFAINDYTLNNTLTFTHNKGVVSVLADINGDILYSTNHNLIGDTIKSIEKKPNLKTVNSTYYIFSTFNELYSATTDYSLVLITVGMILLSLLLAATISLYIAFQFYKSIYSLYKTFASADVYSEKANDEITQILSSIMKIIDKNEQFEKEINEKIISLRKSQSIALQTQLNPHFLFNTLSMINLMAINITRTDNEVSKAIGLLSELLRASLQTQEYTISLSNELSYVYKFIDIEKIKHNNNFSVKYDISEETKNCKVIKFMLQPIIENAFEHGINHIKNKEKCIKIISRRVDNNLVISVKNNGKLLSESEIEEINNRLKTEVIPEDKHIGMFNVNSRIKILFGSQYGCSIGCCEGETSVTLSLPFENF